MFRRLIVAAAVVAVSGALAAPVQATVHGKNGRIVYRRYFNATHTAGAIFTVLPDGSKKRQVTHPKHGVLTTEPDWSPNGRWIVYQIQNSDSLKVFKIRRDGTSRTRLSQTCTGTCTAYSFPAWSPNGKRIAVERDMCSVPSHGLSAIDTISSNGSHTRRITMRGATCAKHHRFSDAAPQWAPTGRRVTFQRFDNKRQHLAIFTSRLDGTHQHRLTPWRIDASQPDWSPNGDWIVFRTQEDSDTRGNIAMVQPDGSGLHLVTHGGANFKWQSCSFSPNGKKITAGRNPGVGSAGNADVFVMNLDGSSLRNITHSNSWESAPDWGSRQ